MLRYDMLISRQASFSPYPHYGHNAISEQEIPKARKPESPISGDLAIFITEALAFSAFNRGYGPVAIFKFAVIIAKLEFAQITVKVFFADTVIDAVQAALKDGKETLDRIGVNESAHVFPGAVICRVVTAGVIFFNPEIGMKLVRDDG